MRLKLSIERDMKLKCREEEEEEDRTHISCCCRLRDIGAQATTQIAREVALRGDFHD